MGVNTKSFDNASDMITFSRASGAYGFTKVGYGSELVTNGTFDSGTSSWTALSSATLSVVSGALRVTNVGANFGKAEQSLSVTSGNYYKVTFDKVGGTSANANFRVGTTSAGLDIINNVNVITNASYEYLFQATASTIYLSFVNDGTDANYNDFDNISVKEVTYNSSAADATLKLIYHPNDVPRIEYNLDGTAKGLLIEEARTNLFTNSDAVDSTLTNVQNLTVGNEEVSSGVYQGTWRKFTEDTSTGQHRLVGSDVVTISAGSYATFSCMVKRISGTRNVELVMYSGADSFRASFDLDAETTTTTTFGTGVSGIATIENLGDGIFLISMSGIVSSTATTIGAFLRFKNDTTTNYTGDGTSSIAVTGMQIEQGAFRTSLIKTTGSTVHRAFDLASIPVSKFGYNQSEGTLFVDFKTPDTANANALELGDSAVSTKRYLIRNGLAYYSTAGGVQVIINYTASTNNQRAGFAVQSNDAVAVVNGSTVGTDNSVTLFSNPTILGIGASPYYIAAEKLNGHIKSIKYYPRRLSNAQLVELTS